MLSDQGTGRLVRPIGEESSRAGPRLHRYLVTSSAQPAHEFRNHGNTGLAGRLFPGYRDAHITNLMHADLSELLESADFDID